MAKQTRDSVQNHLPSNHYLQFSRRLESLEDFDVYSVMGTFMKSLGHQNTYTSHSIPSTKSLPNQYEIDPMCQQMIFIWRYDQKKPLQILEIPIYQFITVTPSPTGERENHLCKTPLPYTEHTGSLSLPPIRISSEHAYICLHVYRPSNGVHPTTLPLTEELRNLFLQCQHYLTLSSLKREFWIQSQLLTPFALKEQKMQSFVRRNAKTRENEIIWSLHTWEGMCIPRAMEHHVRIKALRFKDYIVNRIEQLAWCSDIKLTLSKLSRCNIDEWSPFVSPASAPIVMTSEDLYHSNAFLFRYISQQNPYHPPPGEKNFLPARSSSASKRLDTRKFERGFAKPRLLNQETKFLSKKKMLKHLSSTLNKVSTPNYDFNCPVKQNNAEKIQAECDFEPKLTVSSRAPHIQPPQKFSAPRLLPSASRLLFSNLSEIQSKDAIHDNDSSLFFQKNRSRSMNKSLGGNSSYIHASNNNFEQSEEANTSNPKSIVTHGRHSSTPMSPFPITPQTPSISTRSTEVQISDIHRQNVESKSNLSSITDNASNKHPDLLPRELHESADQTSSNLNLNLSTLSFQSECVKTNNSSIPNKRCGDISRADLIVRYRDKCNAVCDGLYIGGWKVAQDLEILKEHNITHIINTAGNVLENFFPNLFHYKTYNLEDSRNENIEWVLYDALQYLESVFSEATSNHVYIHCQEGISRSATFATAYLMWKFGWTFGKALEQVRKTRPICNPNTGFTYQLLLLEKRLGIASTSHCPDENSNLAIRTPYLSPSRLFLVVPPRHPDQTEFQLSPIENHTTSEKPLLDSRFAFVVRFQQNIFLWIGCDCIYSILACTSAESYQKKIQRFENCFASMLFKVKMKNETTSFWEAVGLSISDPIKIQEYKNLMIKRDDTLSYIFEEISQWMHLHSFQIYSNYSNSQVHKELSVATPLSTDKPTLSCNFIQESPCSIASEDDSIISLYQYPDLDKKITLFDTGDLQPHGLFVVVNQTNPQSSNKTENSQAKVSIWIWVGSQYKLESVEEPAIRQKFMKNLRLDEPIRVSVEMDGSESDVFWTNFRNG